MRCTLCTLPIKPRWWERLFSMPMCRDEQACYRRFVELWDPHSRSTSDEGWCDYCMEPKPVTVIKADGFGSKKDTHACKHCAQLIADEYDRRWREWYP